MITVEYLSHCFEDRWVLKDRRFCVNSGETVAVLGPNGSGKTTLLKILATLLLPTRGNGNLFGFDLREDAREIRKNLHWLGHESGLYGPFTARENLDFFCRLQGTAPQKEKIEELLEEMGLGPFRKMRVGNFSAGMKKRLALAKLLLKKVPLILLDEPHTNLDKSGRVLMDRCLRQWRKEGVTLFLASHDEAIIRPLSDQLLLLGGDGGDGE